MIVRILGSGQFELPADAMEHLNRIDDALTSAIDSDDEQAFRAGLADLLTAIKQRGTPVADDYLGPSELVLPGEDATVEQIKELLTEEGLIPD
ncbi:MAG: PspA-associated protein PspAA [Actinomycetota bacterium]